jgi:hypothetical protein
MKKLTTVLIVLLFSGTMFGQFHFGPQVGYTASNLTVSGSDIVNNLKSNFLIGAFARFGEKIYVQPEVNWLTQGSSFSYQPSLDDPLNVEQSIKLNSIQVPLSVGWRVINLKVVNIRVMGGITANFITNVVIDNDPPSGSDYWITQDDFKNVQWQWQLGAGVDVFMFALDVKYFGGINDIMNTEIPTIDGQGKSISSKSNLFQVTLGWKIF